MPSTRRDIYVEIADRLATQTEEQVIRLGRRSGQWTEAHVDWVAAGNQGPMPPVPADDTANADASPLVDQLAAAGLVEIVEVVDDAGQVPPPAAAETEDEPTAEAATEPEPEAAVAEEQPAQAARPDDRDLLARGLSHPDPKVRAIATKALAAVDQLVTALARRPS